MMRCGIESHTTQFSWVCINEDCDGVHHYWAVDHG